MCAEDGIGVSLMESDGDTSIVRISTPLGEVELIGDITFIGRLMSVDRAHIEGPGPGALGRAALNAIAAKLLVIADVDEIIIQGSVRTTGRNRGRAPKLIRFRR